MSICTLCVFDKIFSSCHLFSENLRLPSPANSTISLNNFIEFLSSSVYLFIVNNIITITIMLSTNTPCLCHLLFKNLYVREELRVRNILISLFQVERS